jgi:hypothetical protein
VQIWWYFRQGKGGRARRPSALGIRNLKAGLTAPILAAAGVNLLKPGEFDRAAFVEATAGVLESTARSIDDSVMRYFR